MIDIKLLENNIKFKKLTKTDGLHDKDIFKFFPIISESLFHKKINKTALIHP